MAGPVAAGRLRDGPLVDREVVVPLDLRVVPARVDRARFGRVADGVAWPPSDTGTLVRGFPPGLPAACRVATLEAATAPEAIVTTPPRTARAPSDAPALAALPPMLVPVPSADPTVRTAA